MAGLTLALARTQMSRHLDDATNVRWSTTSLDAHLEAALSMCLSEYVMAGGDRFREEVSGTTTASDNTVDLSSYDPLKITGVAYNQGTAFYPISQVTPRDRGTDAEVAATLKITLTRNLALPTTTSHPLVGQGATEVGTWKAFDNWIVAEAAMMAMIQDAEVNPALASYSERLKASCLEQANISSSRKFPERESYLSRLYSYSVDQAGQTIRLHRALRWGR